MRRSRGREKALEPVDPDWLGPRLPVAKGSRSSRLGQPWPIRRQPAGPTAIPHHAQVIALPRRHATQAFMQSIPINIDSLAKYRPVSKNHQVSIAFSGEAGAAMGRLMSKLELANPNDVVKLAIALLLTVQGREIRLTDTKTGEVQVVEI
jgi:hypothetical protein